jgi:hypothetical protein
VSIVEIKEEGETIQINNVLGDLKILPTTFFSPEKDKI